MPEPQSVPVASTGAGRSSVLPMLAIALVCLVAVTRLVLWAWTQQVSFDGAMNLEAARSLVEGHGYRRMYADHEAFSHAVQTRAPYILPAAAVFAAFGVGLWQAQLVNLIYLFALAAIAFAIVRRRVSVPWAALAATVILCTPQIQDVGLNGYGEVPALAWWLAALPVLYRANGEREAGLLRCLLAGVLIGMAMLTKTVLLIGLVAVLPVFAIERWRQRRDVAFLIAGLVALLAGSALPAAVHEAGRFLYVADFASWKHWLHDELLAVHQQAGVRSGFNDTGSLARKVATHFGVLLDAMGVAGATLVIWFGLTTAMFAAALRRSPQRARPLLLTLALFALIYFLWWLGVTPTQKAWYRRIFDGVVVLQLLLILCCGLVWKARRVTRTTALTVTAVILLQGIFAFASFSAENWPTARSQQALAEDLAQLAALPADATLYGIGWYSVPTKALYSGRHIEDLHARAPAFLATQPPSYLLLDPSMQVANIGDHWLRRYPNREIAASTDLRLVELDTSKVLDPFAAAPVDVHRLQAYVTFKTDDYPYAFGFYDLEGDGWRWARADVEVLLQYSGERAFKLDMYMPDLSMYETKSPLGIGVWAGDCRLGEIRQDQPRLMQWWLPAGNCPLQNGPVRIRLVSDNFLRSKTDSQMSLVVRGLGFDGGG